ncbi:esterase YqiA [Sulfuriferula plumbiphila]|uniref:Esterase YqiA n=1 Tax=Sulfuriferula plumbiphila TaxID=171865 RepID=A0A512L3A3_9PROT|nr:YqiA/YcfP family alpha/beta fold hydrolase [Sulfuriferula plumbiphila]BBP02628.1 esterase YqiA [Sulfuriferula plumbiphila]GEP28922.1 esterase YqiA [Sulfuriferula plumbiphila]
MIIYIHGFNSASGSGKARELHTWLAAHGRGAEFACPDLPHRPAAAIALLSERISALPGAQVKLIGSSLGGFYATWLADRFDVKAALINPAVHVQHALKSALGPQKNYHTGEEYVFTQQHLDELAVLDRPAPLRPQNLLLLVETGDAVLDYRDAVNYYAASRQIVVPGGDHGFQSFPQYIETILEF